MPQAGGANPALRYASARFTPQQEVEAFRSPIVNKTALLFPKYPYPPVLGKYSSDLPLAPVPIPIPGAPTAEVGLVSAHECSDAAQSGKSAFCP